MLDDCDKHLIKFIEHSNKIEGINDPREVPFSIIAWNDLIRLDRLFVGDILNVHKNIMMNLRPDIAGKIRNCYVTVGGRSCPHPEFVEDLLDDWVFTYGKGVKTAAHAKQSHIDFERIHPFEDGNGRTGRLLWLWFREKAKLPFQHIKYEDRFKYYEWFADKRMRRNDEQ